MGSSRRWIGRRVMLAALFALTLTALVTVRNDTRAATVTVTIQNLAFAPGSVTVAAGTTVTWINQEPADAKVPHTATSDSGAWNSGLMNPGASFSFTFAKAGTFAYHCDVHPNMHGTIVVTAPATPTATHAPPTAAPTIAPPTPTAPALAPTATPTIRPTATVKPAPTATKVGATPAATATTATSGAIATATDTPPPSSSSPPASVAADDPPPPGANPFLAVPSFTDSPTERFMAQTGHSLKNDFRTFWETRGGAAIFGYPVSEEYREREADGIVRTVQYFERARFEYHDELAGTPDAVELGALARELTARRTGEQPFQPVPATGGGSDRIWFDGTGHSLSGVFKQFWDTNGGVAIFGLSISEPFMEQGADGTSYLVQYFERARFELHVTPSGTSVELGRLGVQYAQWYGIMPSA